MVLGLMATRGMPVHEVRADGRADGAGATIVAGDRHTAVLRDDGTVWAWGRNYHGQLGDGTAINRLSSVQVQGLDNVTMILAKGSNTFALRNDGTVWAVGTGSLIDGSGISVHAPTQIQGLDNIISIAAGASHAIALRSDGTVWAWGGGNWLGQLGDGTTTNRTTSIAIATPTQVNNLSNIVAISSNGYHSLALRSDGTVWAWGSNFNERRGVGASGHLHTPAQVQGLTNIAAISAGDDHSVALRSDGTVWAWGNNAHGRLGDGTVTHRNAPVQVQDLSNVIAISAGFIHTVALRGDGTVWAWGSNSIGQIGDGTTDSRWIPTQVHGLNNVTAISAGGSFTAVLRDDGSVWAWGANHDGQLGDGTTVNRSTPIQVPGVSNVMQPGSAPAVQPAPVTSTSLINPTTLNTITNQQTAVQAVRNALNAMTPEELETGLIEMFAEQAIGRAASQTITGSGIVVNLATIEPLQSTAISTRDAINAMFVQEGYTPRRDLSANVSFFTTDGSSIEVLVEPSANQALVQHVRVRTPYYELAFPPGFIEAEVASIPLTVTVTTGNSYTVGITSNGASYVGETIRLSVPPIQGDVTYQTLVNTAGDAVGGRYNPATGLLDARIRESDTYIVVENRIDFSDIQHLSREMQEAIRVLASQGVISGTGAGQFSPGDSINRAQVAALTMRMLSQLDPNADGGFIDVLRADWFFGAAGSASRQEIMFGTGTNIFSPNVTMQRDQLTVLSARILRNEMGYRAPANPNQYLQVFTDRSDFAEWSLADIALATRENIVVFRVDGRFMPAASMNRGDVALTLYRLYLRLW